MRKTSPHVVTVDSSTVVMDPPDVLPEIKPAEWLAAAADLRAGKMEKAFELCRRRDYALRCVEVLLAAVRYAEKCEVAIAAFDPGQVEELEMEQQALGRMHPPTLEEARKLLRRASQLPDLIATAINRRSFARIAKEDLEAIKVYFAELFTGEKGRLLGPNVGLPWEVLKILEDFGIEHVGKETWHECLRANDPKLAKRKIRASGFTNVAGAMPAPPVQY